MKKLLLGMIIGSMSAVSWSACTYNLDITQAQANAANSANSGRQIKLMPAINLAEQKGTGIIEYLNGVAVDQIATSSNFANNFNINNPLVDKADPSQNNGHIVPLKIT